MTTHEELALRAVAHDTVVRTAHAQDARDWAAYAQCFHTDVVYLHPGGRIDGIDTVITRSEKALGPLDSAQHLIGSVLVTVHADRAEVVSYFRAQHVRAAAEGGPLYTIAGTYRDTLTEGADGQWRISQRVQEYSWRDGNPAVIIR